MCLIPPRRPSQLSVEIWIFERVSDHLENSRVTCVNVADRSNSCVSLLKHSSISRSRVSTNFLGI